MLADYEVIAAVPPPTKNFPFETPASRAAFYEDIYAPNRRSALVVIELTSEGIL